MDIKRKLEIAEQSIRSISTHDDQDSALRIAAMERLEKFIEAERQSMVDRVNESIARTVAGA